MEGAPGEPHLVLTQLRRSQTKWKVMVWEEKAPVFFSPEDAGLSTGYQVGAAVGHQGAWVTEGAMTGGPSLCPHGSHQRYERMSTEGHVALNTMEAGHRDAGLTLARREGEPLSQDDIQLVPGQ